MLGTHNHCLWNMGPRVRGDDASDDEPIQPDCVSLFQVFLEKIHGARGGGWGARGGAPPPRAQRDPVLRGGVDVLPAAAPALFFDVRDAAPGQRGFFAAEVLWGRPLRLLVGVLGDLPAVIADGS